MITCRQLRYLLTAFESLRSHAKAPVSFELSAEMKTFSRKIPSKKFQMIDRECAYKVFDIQDVRD